MARVILSILIFLSTICLAQVKKLDMIELRSGKIMVGKVEKIKSESVEFTEYTTTVLYEFKKSEVKKIDLANGEILTFEDFNNDTEGVEQVESQTQTVLAEKDNEPSEGARILVSICVGYAALNMDEVNKDLEDSQNLISSVGGITSSPDEITGGLFLEGNFKIGIGNFNLGVSGSYISSSGSFSYNDISGSFEENYDVSTIEILGLFEILFPIENSPVQPFIQLAGGVGMASAEHLGDFRLYSDPSANISVKNTVDGNYFAGRVKGGLQFVLQNIILEVAAGYRIANAGELKGDHVENGITFQDMPVRDISGNPIEFDYSGLLVTAGVSISL